LQNVSTVMIGFSLLSRPRTDERGVGITALTITRRDGAKGLPKSGAAQIEWNLTGTMLFVRYGEHLGDTFNNSRMI
jgi:hypothetical protein